MNNYANTNGPAPSANAQPEAMTLEWVASRIDTIIQDKTYMEDAYSTLKSMEANGHNSRAEAIKQMMLSREATNQQALRFLEKIYDKLTYSPAEATPTVAPININELADYVNSEDLTEIIKTIYKTA